MLKKQLTKKFGQIAFIYLEKIENAEADKLLAWGDKVLEATTLAEIFESEAALAN